MRTVKNTSDTPIFQCKITLLHSKPPIWRRLLVPSHVTLADLHHIIQAAFGWWDSHLHQFIVGGAYYGEPHPDYSDFMEMRDEQDFTLGQIAAVSPRFEYEYDFGDDWMHQVLVEKVLPPEPGRNYPVCVKGRRTCPPEDVGGIWGYESFLEAIADPNHEEHDSYLEWVGGEFDPEAFDLEATNQALDVLREGGMRWLEEAEQEIEVRGTLTLIDRTVVVIKPKQPLVDWVNKTELLSEPLTLADVVDDQTAILVPDLGSRQAVLEYLEPLKLLLFEIELEGWYRDPSSWPEERTPEMFDAWFDVEVHSMVWDLRETPNEEE